MIITSVKTHKVTLEDKDIVKVLDKYLTEIPEKSVVDVTSKIVSITEGRVAEISKADKDELIKKESQYYLPREKNPYSVSLTITKNILAAAAGIDESNGNGYYILWPSNPQETANRIRARLKSRFSLKNVGVIITDSRTMPLRWGVTAIAIAYSGFEPLKDYIGSPDLFGRKFEFEKMSVADNLAGGASLVMGEGSERTPIAVISDIPNIVFQDRNPTEEEIAAFRISIEEDLYSPLIKGAPWEKGLGS